MRLQSGVEGELGIRHLQRSDGNAMHKAVHLTQVNLIRVVSFILSKNEYLNVGATQKTIIQSLKLTWKWEEFPTFLFGETESFERYGIYQYFILWKISHESTVMSISDGRAKQNQVTSFVNLCVFVALPREGIGRVWREEEVLAFPRNLPRPTPRVAANT